MEVEWLKVTLGDTTQIKITGDNKMNMQSLLMLLLLVAHTSIYANNLISIRIDDINTGQILTLEANTPVSLGQFANQKISANELIALGFSMASSRQKDPLSGIFSSRLNTKPVKFSKYVDSASALLLSAMMTGDPLNIAINFYRENGNQLTNFYRITLRNAQITDISTQMDNYKNPAETNVQEFVTLKFKSMYIENFNVNTKIELQGY